MEDKNLLFNLADKISKDSFEITLDFPQKFQFSLADQLRRASLSIVLNIVEGGARISKKEKKQFLNIAFGSLKETKYLLYFAKDLDLINRDDFEEIIVNINHLAKIIYGLLYKK